MDRERADQSAEADLSSVRSVLFVPASRPDFFSKALASRADMVLIDLEDSVPDEAIADARRNLSKFLNRRTDLTRHVAVRTHGVRAAGFAADLDVAVHRRVAMLVLPKVHDPEDLRTATAQLDEIESHTFGEVGRMRVMPMLESALAIHKGLEILTATSRIVGAGFAGAEDGDLLNDLGAVWTRSGRSTIHVRSEVLLLARAARSEMILDGVWTRIDDEHGFAVDTALGRDLGYTGRFVVHPGQIDIVNRAYTPTEDEVRLSIELLAAARERERAGVGAFKHEGRLIDQPMLMRAERTVDRARRAGMVANDEL